jgi:hypothetical protein
VTIPVQLPSVAPFLPLVPVFLLVCNLLLKRFALGKGLEVAGADLVLAGYSIFLTSSLRAVATRGLSQEHTLYALLGAGGILILWVFVLLWIKSFSRASWPVFLPSVTATYGIGCGVCWVCYQFASML